MQRSFKEILKPINKIMNWKSKLYNITKKTIITSIGSSLCVFSAIIVLALFSFNVEDISFNTESTNKEIKNWIGIFGSHISDLLFQLIGLSAFFLCLILFSFGLKMLEKRKIEYLYLKLTLIPFCLLIFCVFFASLNSPNWWIFNSLGGVNGDFILHQLNIIPKPIIMTLSLILSFATLSIIIEITLNDWKYFVRYNVAIARYLIGKLTDLAINFGYFLKNKITKSENKPETTKEKRKKSKKDNKNIENNKKTINKTRQIIKASNNSNYDLPIADLLTIKEDKNKINKISKVQLEEQAKMLVKVLEDYNILGKSLGIKLGPVITLHEFEPAPGTKSSRVIGLADDIARSMSAVSTRIAVIAGKTSIGIELPNKIRK